MQLDPCTHTLTQGTSSLIGLDGLYADRHLLALCMASLRKLGSVTYPFPTNEPSLVESFGVAATRSVGRSMASLINVSTINYSHQSDLQIIYRIILSHSLVLAHRTNQVGSALQSEWP